MVAAERERTRDEAHAAQLTEQQELLQRLSARISGRALEAHQASSAKPLDAPLPHQTSPENQPPQQRGARAAFVQGQSTCTPPAGSREGRPSLPSTRRFLIGGGPEGAGLAPDRRCLLPVGVFAPVRAFSPFTAELPPRQSSVARSRRVRTLI